MDWGHVTDFMQTACILILLVMQSRNHKRLLKIERDRG